MHLKQRVCSVQANAVGKDYFVGDLHGQFDQLQDLLGAVAFGPSDRLFSVGDLIDRGPRSWDLLQWFASTKNCHAVLGNHDALLLASFTTASRAEAIRKWASMDSAWFVALCDEKRELARRIVTELPLAMSISLADGRRVGLIHAGLQISAPWSAFWDYQDNRIDAADIRGKDPNSAALWGRAHALAAIHADWAGALPMDLSTRYAVFRGLQPAAELDLLLAGHTPLPGRSPLLGGNRLFIDTGGFHGDGWLTMVEPVGQRVFQAPNQSSGCRWIEKAWPKAVDVNPFRLTSAEVSEVQKIYRARKGERSATSPGRRSQDHLA